MAKIIKEVTSKCSLAQQYLLHKGLKKFGKEGEKAIGKEMGQLRNQTCWMPMSVTDMNANERRRAQLALAHSSKKSSREIKGRLVFNNKRGPGLGGSNGDKNKVLDHKNCTPTTYHTVLKNQKLHIVKQTTPTKRNRKANWWSYLLFRLSINRKANTPNTYFIY